MTQTNERLTKPTELSDAQLRVIYQTTARADRIHMVRTYLGRLDVTSPDDTGQTPRAFCNLPVVTALGSQRRPQTLMRRASRPVTKPHHLPLVFTTRPLDDETLLQMQCIDTTSAEFVASSLVTVCSLRRVGPEDSSNFAIFDHTHFSDRQIALGLARLRVQSAVGIIEQEPIRLVDPRRLAA